MSERTVNVSVALTPAQVELLGKLALVYKEGASVVVGTAIETLARECGVKPHRAPELKEVRG